MISHHLDYWIDGYGGKKVFTLQMALGGSLTGVRFCHATSTVWLAELAK